MATFWLSYECVCVSVMLLKLLCGSFLCKLKQKRNKNRQLNPRLIIAKTRNRSSYGSSGSLLSYVSFDPQGWVWAVACCRVRCLGAAVPSGLISV